MKPKEFIDSLGKDDIAKITLTISKRVLAEMTSCIGFRKMQGNDFAPDYEFILRILGAIFNKESQINIQDFTFMKE